MLGLDPMGKTSDNLFRTREGVVNLPTQERVTHVDRLAITDRQEPRARKENKLGISLPAGPVRPCRSHTHAVTRRGATPNRGMSGADGGRGAGVASVREEGFGERIRDTGCQAARRRVAADGR